MATVIKDIVTHESPHLDEIAAYWKVLRFGKKKFPGADIARLYFVDNNAEIIPRKGLLALGVGGGQFDEHPKPGKERKRDECTATLIAKYIGVDMDDENMVRILNFVKNADLNASGGTFDLAQMVKMLHAQGKPTDEVIAWVFQALDAKLDDEKESGDFSLQNIAYLIRSQNEENPDVAYEWFKFGMEARIAEQKKFFRETYTEFENNAAVEKIQGTHRELTIVAIESDNDQIARLARSKKYGVDADIVVQMSSNGNFGIYTNQKHGKINLELLVRMLNFEEQKISGNITETNWDVLSSEGMIDGGRWYYHMQGQFILNGSKTAHVEPTRIPPERIIELVKIYANPIQEIKKHCDCTICISSRKNPCELYGFGIGLCKKIRYDMKNQG